MTTDSLIFFDNNCNSDLIYIFLKLLVYFVLSSGSQQSVSMFAKGLDESTLLQDRYTYRISGVHFSLSRLCVLLSEN